LVVCVMLFSMLCFVFCFRVWRVECFSCFLESMLLFLLLFFKNALHTSDLNSVQMLNLFIMYSIILWHKHLLMIMHSFNCT
jgi:hypothetical protein